MRGDAKLGDCTLFRIGEVGLIFVRRKTGAQRGNEKTCPGLRVSMEPYCP